MSIDVWFPLAIYYEDLAGSEQHKTLLVERIKALRESSGEQRTSTDSSWTGDIHNVDRIHFDPAFEWVTAQVGAHALQHLKSLGHDLNKIDLYIQRSWPVIGKKGQLVAPHAHHTAHLSAVYYVSVPQEGDAGQLSFINDARPNELSTGIGSSMTGGYNEYNALNYGSAVYKPIEGRLLLFPAKQTHGVAPNQTDEDRISISFDLVITAHSDAESGRHEFLMPSPSVWKKIDCAEQESEATQDNGRGADTRTINLSDVTGYRSPSDAYTLLSLDNHMLWGETQFPHCSSPAAWQEYSAVIANIPKAEWNDDSSHKIGLWHRCQDWRVFQDAVDTLYCHLRDRDIPAKGASLTSPVLQKYGSDTDTTLIRGKSHLCVYVRVDYENSKKCFLEYSEDEPIEFAPGTMILVSGFRRHRIHGPALVLHFQLDLPSLARPNVMQTESLHEKDVEDTTVFLAATAQPLELPLPPPELLFKKIEWLNARAHRRQRHDNCPVVQKFLINNEDPGSATLSELDLVRQHGITSKDIKNNTAVIIENVATLSDEQCALLCDHARNHMTSTVADTVDDFPEYQVNLTMATLENLLGSETMQRLYRLPEQMGAKADTASDSFYHRIDIFLRMYSPKMRPYIAFHADLSAFTVNIALISDHGTDGGNLLVLYNDRLRIIRRQPGAALLHAGNVVHGVSNIKSGERYTLIMFFHTNQEN